jgi:serine/threonine-protein phosphatase 6 catalytic subunit
MLLNVDACIETLKGGECVNEKELKQLCQYVSALLMEESNVQPVLSPVTIVGDLHGQFFDFINLLKVGGWPPSTSYIFLGDFVDRGHNSVETLSLLLCLKLKYPGHVTLLRGNHEVRTVCVSIYCVYCVSIYILCIYVYTVYLYRSILTQPYLSQPNLSQPNLSQHTLW